MDGAYDIRPSDPVPLLVVACTIHEGLWGTVGDLYVHDTLLPGESIDAKTASLQLSWSGKELRPNVSLELRALPASYRFPIQSPHSAMTRLWTVADPLTMSSIPVSITQIRVGRVWHPLMLREGKTTRIVCGIGADGGVAVLSTSIE
jgi:hypothetical protein